MAVALIATATVTPGASPSSSAVLDITAATSAIPPASSDTCATAEPRSTRVMVAGNRLRGALRNHFDRIGRDAESCQKILHGTTTTITEAHVVFGGAAPVATADQHEPRPGI